MTAHILLRRVFKVEKGHRILVHAAAGGVGQILVQWAHSLGATVIGTAGSEEKVKLVKELGADHVINYKTQDFVQEVRCESPAWSDVIVVRTKKVCRFLVFDTFASNL